MSKVFDTKEQAKRYFDGLFPCVGTMTEIDPNQQRLQYIINFRESTITIADFTIDKMSDNRWMFESM